MFHTRDKRSGSSTDARRAMRFACPLLVFGLFTSAALGIGMDPPEEIAGDDVGTLPSVWGGFDSDWEVDGLSDLGNVGVKDPNGFQVLQRPAYALVGPPSAVLSSITSATGEGYTIVESLANGEQRISFHGDVLVGVDAAFLTAGVVRAELVVAGPYAPAHAAVQWNGSWTQPFALTGGAFDVPAGALLSGARSQSAQIAAIGTLGETYRLDIQPAAGVLWAQQGQF